MITEISLKNWKSFEESRLFIDPLTFVIGTNASGKSNILDALSFLCNSAKGIPINEIAQSTRGGSDWLIRKGADAFELSATIDNDGENIIYTLSCRKNDNSIQLAFESLELCSKTKRGRMLFTTDTAGESPLSPAIPTRFYQEKPGRQKKLDLNRQTTVLSQIDNLVTVKKVKEASLLVQNTLKSIFILNPIPNHMRDYSPLSERLNPDAGNIAGLLAGMDPNNQEKVERKLTEYVKPLPDKDIKRIWAEKVGRFESDAMLYCEEEWIDGERIEIDARSMSDGTLRFIAIVVALLTGKAGSLLLIEEVDNGLHPSRSQELVNVLKVLGAKSKIDIICTTHNPVLIDAFGHEMIPFISYVSRSSENGSSVINLLEDKQNLAKLMATCSVGDMMTEGVL